MATHYERTGMEMHRKERLKAEKKYFNKTNNRHHVVYYGKYQSQINCFVGYLQNKSSNIIDTHNNNNTKQIEYECSHRDFSGDGYGYISEYHRNGNIKKKYFVKGGMKKYSGYTAYYNEDGVMITELYSSSHLSQNMKREICSTAHLPSHVYIEYYKNGIIRNIIEYTQKDGELDGDTEFIDVNGLTTKYYMNGNLRCEYNYKCGKFDGLCVDYYKTGTIKNNKCVGLYCVKYHKNGYINNFYKNKKIFFY